ncbi:TIGR00730 family Rossman fold protein [Bacillus sp. FJAT-45350]|uniref:LOG family protein n=1 Tax=Bacillus sp. FJAT-45350 TaxID=2011014 RepID=UPI000BB95F3D|nr:TIGR00730 family Rossman fold protein [Bacillus sp. FJAT-45350]
MKAIAVFCGAKDGKKDTYKKGAESLGEALAKNNITLVYGGGSAGLMGAVADACYKAGGTVIGVIPKILVKKEVVHPTLSDIRIVNTMHERKAMMYELSDGFIALPGGIGTIEEFFEVLTWNAIGEHQKPCALLNIDHYYDPFISLFDHMVEEAFLGEEIRDLVLVEEKPDRVIELFKNQNE